MSEESKSDAAPVVAKSSGMSPWGYVSVLFVGTYLGILFTKSEVARWKRVHNMFLFREAYQPVELPRS